MRIPQYDQKINAPNAPQFNNIADVRQDSFSGIIKGLETYAGKLGQEAKQARQLEYYKADTAINYEIEKSFDDFTNEIKNGGDYKDAETRYQKLHDSVVSKYLNTFDEGFDRESAFAQYQRKGLEKSLQLNNILMNRRKSDARQSAQAVIQQKASAYEIVDDSSKGQIVSEIADVVSGAVKAGAIDYDTGKKTVAQFVQDGETKRVMNVAEKNPKSALAMAEKNTAVPEEVKQELKAVVENDDYMEDRIKSIFAGDPNVTQGDVDKVYQGLWMGVQSGKTDTEDAVLATQAIINTQGSFPSPIKKQISSFLGLDVADISDSDVETVQMNYQLYDNATKVAKSKLTLEQRAFLDVYGGQVNSGINNKSALKNTIMAVQNNAKLTTAKKDFVKENNAAEYLSKSAEFGFWNNNKIIDPRVVGDFENAAFALKNAGSTDPFADAKKEMDLNYGVYKDSYMKHPPKKFYGIDDDMFTEVAIKPVITSAGLQYEDGKYKIVSDKTTEAQVESGGMPSYAIMELNEFGNVVGVVGRTKGVKRNVNKVDVPQLPAAQPLVTNGIVNPLSLIPTALNNASRHFINQTRKREAARKLKDAPK